jgi:hypothetical protein
MRTRVAALVAAIAAVLALGVGAALAAPSGGMWGGWTDPGRMHGSAQMRAMHAQMPADSQAECDALHAQMSGQMSTMMTGGMHGWTAVGGR